MQANLILVHGLFARSKAIAPDNIARARSIAEHGEALGVCEYEWITGRNKRLANHFLARARGTARAVDAVEVIELNEAKVRASLADETTRAHWQQTLSCAPYGLDSARSFILMGTPRQQRPHRDRVYRALHRPARPAGSQLCAAPWPWPVPAGGQ